MPDRVPDTKPDPPATTRYRSLDARALRALAHPLRVELFDILSQYGPQTASTLAAMTGESTGATSYHLRALAKHDLIREIEGRGTTRERWWERPVGGVSFADRETLATPSGRAASHAVMSQSLTRRHEQLMAFVESGFHGDSDAWDEASMISTGTARMTLEQTAELTTRMQALIDETVDRYRTQTGEGVRPVTLRADVFPIPEKLP